MIIVEENLSKRERVWIFLMQLGARAGCHQMRERSLFFRGYQLPVCARCTGLFIGYILGFIFFIFLLQYDLIILFLCAFFSASILGVDGLLQLKGKYTSNNYKRLITGLTCGFFLICFLMKIIFVIYNKITPAA